MNEIYKELEKEKIQNKIEIEKIKLQIKGLNSKVVELEERNKVIDKQQFSMINPNLFSGLSHEDI